MVVAGCGDGGTPAGPPEETSEFIAYAIDGDIVLYDRDAASFVPLPGLNAEARENSATVSADGRWVAFYSDRSGGGDGARVSVEGRVRQ
jgi:hypothetical protein